MIESALGFIMENHITSKCGFLHLGMIWCEIINDIKRLEREWINSVSLFFRRIEK